MDGDLLKDNSSSVGASSSPKIMALFLYCGLLDV